jgi:formate hydrogenlyase transcriptional activator
MLGATTVLHRATHEPDSTPRIEDTLIKAARSLNASLDVTGVCNAVLDAVEEIYGATSSWILLHDAHQNRLTPCAFRGTGAIVYENVSMAPDTGVLGLAFTSREVVFVPDAQHDDRWFDPSRVQAAGLRSVFAVPLQHKDRPLGVLGLDSPGFDERHSPNADDIARLQALAAQAAIALTNAHLYEKSERDRRRLAALVEERRALRQRMTHLQQEVREAHAFGEIVAASALFKETLQLASVVAPGDTTALLLGETGTGKELLARFIHEHSDRKHRAFVAVNCAALPESLVESELFGHEKGAFTGAIARKIGKFELAHRGTLFLDEIGDLPAGAQAKLLRVLQNAEVQRIGSSSPIRVDVRVIAATNHDLEDEIAQKRFRPDLYYRVSAFPIRLPALRDRLEDVEPLARHFTRVFAAKLRKPITDLAPAALARLQAYAWPGNVRELQNVIERAVILTKDSVIEPEAIALDGSIAAATAVAAAERAPLVAESDSAAAPAAPAATATTAAEVVTLAEAERRAIVAALEATQWRISGRAGAAELLGLRPTTLHAKMKKLGIHRPVPSPQGNHAPK